MQVIKYGILLPDNTLARVEKSANHGDCCGEFTYMLTNNKYDPEWLVDDPNKVGETLFANIRWYNSREDLPCWGKFKREDLRPAKIIITTEIATIEVKIPLNVQIIMIIDIPRNLLKDYVPNIDKNKNYYFVLTNDKIPKEYIGKSVCFNDSIYDSKKILDITKVPEEYSDTAETLLVCER